MIRLALLSLFYTSLLMAQATPDVQIDVPPVGAFVTGTVSLGGWALESVAAAGTNAIASIAVSVDGLTIPATYGAARPDVCAAFPGRIGCPNVGWSATLDTSTFSAGPHTLTVTATDSVGTKGVKTQPFSISGVIGLQGIQGKQGIQGPQGLQGVTGQSGAPLTMTGGLTIAYPRAYYTATYMDGGGCTYTLGTKAVYQIQTATVLATHLSLVPGIDFQTIKNVVTLTPCPSVSAGRIYFVWAGQ